MESEDIMEKFIVTNVTDSTITLQDTNTLESIEVEYNKFNTFYRQNKSIQGVEYSTELRTVTCIGIYKLLQFESIESRNEYITDNGLTDYTEIDNTAYPIIIILVDREYYEKPVKTQRKTKESKEETKAKSKRKEETHTDETRDYVVYTILSDTGSKMYWKGGTDKSESKTTFNINEALLMTKKSATSKSYFMSRNGFHTWKTMKAV